jgi:hypothetical protein
MTRQQFTEQSIQLHHQVFTYYSSVLSGDKHLLDRMKEFWSHLSLSFDASGKFMKQLKKCRHQSEYLRLVDHLFEGKFEV